MGGITRVTREDNSFGGFDYLRAACTIVLAMQNSGPHAQNFHRAIVVLMPGLSTLLTFACVLAYRTAPASWRTGTVESIVGGILVSVSALSFLALCKYASAQTGQ